jgi:hypothetical protein
MGQAVAMDEEEVVEGVEAAAATRTMVVSAQVVFHGTCFNL